MVQKINIPRDLEISGIFKAEKTSIEEKLLE